jgi:hypothetical protein
MRSICDSRSIVLLVGIGALGALSCTDPTAVPAGPLDRIEIVEGQEQSATVGTELPDALTVRALDADGRLVPGVVLTFRVVSGGGSVFAGSAATNSSGIASERWTIGTSTTESQELEVRAVDPETGQARIYAVFHATATAGLPASVAKADGDEQSVPLGSTSAQPLSVVVRDQHANPVPNATVSWAVIGGAGQVSPAIATTGADGRAQTQYTAGTSLSAASTIRASVGGFESPLFTVFTPTGIHHWVVTAPATATVGSTINVSAVGVDAAGNPITIAGVEVFWNLTVGSGGAFSSPSTLTNGSGVASVSYTLRTQPNLVGFIAIGAASTPNSLGTATITVTPGPPAALAVTPPPTTPYGSPMSARVVVIDSYGNTVTSFSEPITVSVTPAPSGGLAGTTTRTPVNGVADFDGLVIQRPDVYTLGATAAGVPAGASTPFTVDAITIASSSASGSAFRGVAVSGSTAYYSLHTGFSGGFFRATPTSGGQATQLAPGFDLAGTANVGRVVVQGSHVYLIEGQLYRAPLAGGAATTVSLTGCTPTGELEVGTSDVIIPCAQGHIVSVPNAGSSVTTIATDAYARTAIAVGGPLVFYTDSVSGSRRIRQVGVALPLATGIGAWAVAPGARMIVIGSELYWGEWDGTPGSGVIRRMPLAGGPITTVASGMASAPRHLVVDGTMLYFLAADAGVVEKVKRLDLASAAPPVSFPLTDRATTFAIDADHIYYTLPLGSGQPARLRKTPR